MGAHQTQLRTRGSSGAHNRPARPDFKIYWEVRDFSGWYVANFPGDNYYPGLTLGRTVGTISRTVQATCQGAMEAAMWNKRAITGGNGGVSGTTLSITANGERIETGCRITGTGIPADTLITAYTGGSTGTATISQAAAVANGTSLTNWRIGGKLNIFAGNAGVSSTSLTVTGGGTNIQVGNIISGFNIPWGTTAVSYTGGSTGTLVISQAAAVPDGTDLICSNGAELVKLFFVDYEAGGESGADMRNILTWYRGATGYASTPFPIGYNSPPIGIYGNNQCAMNRSVLQLALWTPTLLAGYSALNDTMSTAVTGTGDATCNAILPENYLNCRGDVCASIIRWFSSERTRMGLTPPLIPMINPSYPPGTSYPGSAVSGKAWRAILETAIHDPNIAGVYIWHADRNRAWDASEDWFVQTLDFIATYGITSV